MVSFKNININPEERKRRDDEYQAEIEFREECIQTIFDINDLMTEEDGRFTRSLYAQYQYKMGLSDSQWKWVMHLLTKYRDKLSK